MPVNRRDPMVIRFCLYVICHNFKPFEPFFVLFFLLQLKMDYALAASCLAFHQIVWAALEVPGGIVTDRFGRRRALITAFVTTALAYVLFGMVAWDGLNWPFLILGLSLFGLGESLRSGTHKAIMLHWAELNHRSDTVDEVIAFTRFFSKTTGGVAALLGGMLLWFTGSFVSLFALSALFCVAGGWLIFGYPRELEGNQAEPATAEQEQAAPVEKTSLLMRLRRHLPGTALISLIAASVIFESQVKIARTFLQPYLEEGLKQEDIAVIGGIGGLAIGVYFLVQDTFAGYCATLGKHVKKRVNGLSSAVLWVHAVSVAALVFVPLLLWLDWRWVGLPLLLVFNGMQNLRRPLFIAALDQHMDKRLRATTISVETLARALAYALAVLVGGWLADQSGLYASYLVVLLVMAVGLWPAWIAARLSHQPAGKS